MTTLQTTLPVATTLTASATPVAGKHTPVDATSGNLTMTLPTPLTVGARLRVEKIDTSANTVTISGTIRGTATTITLISQYHTIELAAESLTSWRPISDHRTTASQDARYDAVGAATAAQAFAVQRANHTGTQAATTLTGLDAAVAGVVTPGGSATAAALAGDPAFGVAYVPRWKPSTAYTSGDVVLNPSGQVVQALSAFTSGASYAATNWKVVSASAATVVQAGSLGATYTLDFGGTAGPIDLRGTLTANCTITVANPATGAHAALILQQDATGGRTVTISYGAGSASASIAAAANAVSVVELDYDGTDVFVSGGVSTGLSQSVFTAKGQMLIASGNAAAGVLSVSTNGLALLADSSQTLGVRWGSVGGLSNGQVKQNLVTSGQWYAPDAAQLTAARAQGLLEVAPYYTPACTVDQLRTNLTAGGAAGATVRMGIYADDGTGKPSTLIVDGGTAAATGTGFATVTLGTPAVLAAGLYWLACVSQDNATVPTRQTVSNASSRVTPLPRTSTNGWFAGWSSATTVNTGALPSPFGTATLSGSGPMVEVHVQ